MDLLIHGVYDAQTLTTLRQHGIKKIGFDLRGKSPNLIPFHTLTEITKNLEMEKLYLIFENDRESTVLSFLNLLKDVGHSFTLEFRGQESLEYLSKINHPFIWFFNSAADWKSYLMLPQIKGVILPFEAQSLYENADFWEIMEKRNLDIFLHLQSLDALKKFASEEHLTMSVDLNRDVESSFRKVDQERLTILKSLEIRS